MVKISEELPRGTTRVYPSTLKVRTDHHSRGGNGSSVTCGVPLGPEDEGGPPLPMGKKRNDPPTVSFGSSVTPGSVDEQTLFRFF